MKIAHLKFKHGIFLAPLAGVTDITFRRLCRNSGAELTFSEMVSAKALYYKDRKTQELTAAGEGEKPFAVQIFGSEPEIMGYAAKVLSEREDIDIIDINMGCPVAKIVKNNEGSALMKDIKLSEKIIKEVVKNSDKPVTVKTRTGWRNENDIFDFALMIQEAGADAITIHGRTQQQMYGGKANWEIIKRVKEALVLPVIGNGDIFCGDDAKAFKEQSGVDGILVGRGVLGKPWIFEEIKASFEGISFKKPEKNEIMELIISQLMQMSLLMDEKRAVLQMRKHIAWYVKGMKGCNEFKREIFTVCEMAEIIEKIKEYFKND